ncbi:MAG: AAA family ATPase [Wenzhouxiangella sp.]|nr:MAG: AAA family ATPase [Wenzhouxiangella sp.]
MYLEHFGLTDAPFRLTPNLAYRFEDSSQAAARTLVRTALDQGAGFIKVTGEVGLGKTLLCRSLLGELAEPYLTAWLPDPHVSPSTLRSALARDLGVILPSRPTQQEVHYRLQSSLAEQVAAGRRPVFLIDEAQALSDSALETVRLLTNLETEQRKLLQVVLFGQPELDQRLASPKFRQLRQRIVHSCTLEPLDRSDVERYLDHRLAAAGCDRPLFTRAAVAAIARASGGTPRLVNILADKALLAAFGRGKSRAGRGEVRRAVADTEATRDALWWPKWQPTARLAAFSLVAFGVFLALEAWLGGSS